MLTFANVLTFLYLRILADIIMEPRQNGRMAKTRALITETEREQIAGEHGDKRRYEAVSRVRRRVKDELSADVELLDNEHPELLEEVREVVCDE